MNDPIYIFLKDPFFIKTELIRKACPNYSEGQVSLCRLDILHERLTESEKERFKKMFSNFLSQLIDINNQIQYS